MVQARLSPFLEAMVQLLRSHVLFRNQRRSRTNQALVLGIVLIATFLSSLTVRDAVVVRSLSVQNSLLLDRKFGESIVYPGTSGSGALLRTGRRHHIDSRGPLPSIHIIAERHCGSKWITEHLRECFNHTANIQRGLTRWKHWFQEDSDYSLHGIGEKAIVVAQFRHVVQWVKAMHWDSYHSPNHFNLTWHEFVTTPWTMPRIGIDQEIDLQSNETMCQYMFRPNQVIPCLENGKVRVNGYREVAPVYELRNDGSGRPYDSILDLRRDKILNFLSIQNFRPVTAFFPVQYEDMVLQGTQSLIAGIEAALQTKARCAPSPPGRLSFRPLPYKFVDYLHEHVDWDTEALVGYTRDQYLSGTYLSEE